MKMYRTYRDTVTYKGEKCLVTQQWFCSGATSTSDGQDKWFVALRKPDNSYVSVNQEEVK